MARVDRVEGPAVDADTFRIHVILSDQIFLAVNLVIEDLPDDFDGFKIVHISDLQADQLTDQDLMQQYVDTVNRTQPDHGGNARSGRLLYHKQHAYLRKQRPRSYHGPYTLPGAG